ncbi:MAG: type II secretion system protein [Planctomycetota bacterium]|jgi:prepilin-type N-terminal cleavage/methylation domain-containing protein
MVKKQTSLFNTYRHDGFTLTELLVVMSIISLLMSIMLPGLSRARQQAKGVYCMANLRDLTLAWRIYAEDHDLKLCSADTSWNDSGGYNWVADGPMVPGNYLGGTEQAVKDGALYRYTYMVDLYKCKSDMTELVRSYSLSRTMNGKTCGCDSNNLKTFETLLDI